MSKEMNFGYLGPRFQQSLLKTIIEDKKFGDSIVEVIESNYFDGVYFRVIMEHIKELYVTLNSVPAY